ncbi:hypothetical protein KFE94_16440 [bacterium SCSIO 12643]|nr:hypothetical protein KFE94_16440 [bacterium SCSIO 12643]
MKRRNYNTGGGSAMFSSYLQNIGLLNTKKSYFETRKEWLKVSKKKQIKDPKKATPEQLRQIRNQLVKDRERDNWIRFISALATIIISMLLISGLIYYVRRVFDF